MDIDASGDLSAEEIKSIFDRIGIEVLLIAFYKSTELIYLFGEIGNGPTFWNIDAHY